MEGGKASSFPLTETKGNDCTSTNNDGQESPISKSAFFGASLGIFSLGILYGVRRAMKQEQEPLSSVKNNVQGMHLGAKAFLLGSLLCLGSAAGLGALFIYKTGITDTKQFGIKAKEYVKSLGIFPEFDFNNEEFKKEAEEMEKDIEEFITTVSTAIGFTGPTPENKENQEKESN